MFGVLLLCARGSSGALTGDRAVHNLLDRPRDAPGRTAFGAAFFTWVILDLHRRLGRPVYVFFGLSYRAQIWAYRVLIWVVPPIVFFLARRVCRELLRSEQIQHDREAAEREAEREAEHARDGPASVRA